MEQIPPIATGVNASPGAASGAIALDADTAEHLGKAGQAVILVLPELTPDATHGVIHAAGLLTVHGGISSDAALVARGLGKPYVAGCPDLSIDAVAGRITLGEVGLTAGDVITVDGDTGKVFLGAIGLVAAECGTPPAAGDTTR